MDFRQLLDRFTAAVEAGDGKALGEVFTEDGQYHDTFYGTFQGRAAIADLLEYYIWRDAGAFKWEMLDPVDDGHTGYARWRFSQTAKIEEGRGRRVYIEGVGFFRLADGLIESYEEYARIGEALVQLGLPDGKTIRVLEKLAAAQRATPEAAAHMEA
ncbi:MAG: nuclear transport factor 2 family protein [Alphaproteobacteria bacterium]|jgi:ketosteroid isomerase-like protein|nr:nuclear transport factor 2 family protein [Alphaproteobacteria bacterium]